MPRPSARQETLKHLQEALSKITVAQAMELLNLVMHQLDAELADNSDSSYTTSSSSTSSTSSTSSSDHTHLSHSEESEDSNPLFFLSEEVLTYQNTIRMRIDEVQRACVLHTRIPTIHAPQIHLLREWKLHRPWLFRRKLRMSHEVFTQLVKKIQDHPVFLTSNHQDSGSDSDDMPLPGSRLPREQLPVWLQLAVFLNAAGHYGNAATSQDMAEWAGISVGTVYNCYRRVMLSLLHLHDEAIHFDPAHCEEDFMEKEQAKNWVESRSVPGWRGGFLCVDGTTFNFFQKPGHHGEVFFDRKSQYSVTNQVSLCLLHYYKYSLCPRLWFFLIT